MLPLDRRQPLPVPLDRASQFEPLRQRPRVSKDVVREPQVARQPVCITQRERRSLARKPLEDAFLDCLQDAVLDQLLESHVSLATSRMSERGRTGPRHDRFR